MPLAWKDDDSGADRRICLLSRTPDAVDAGFPRGASAMRGNAPFQGSFWDQGCALAPERQTTTAITLSRLHGIALPRRGEQP